MPGGQELPPHPSGVNGIASSHRRQNHVIFLENFFDELRRKVPLSGK